MPGASRNCRLTTASTSMPGMAAWSAPDAPSITESPSAEDTPGAGAGRPGPGAGPQAATASAATITTATLRATEQPRVPALAARMIPLV